MTRSGSTVLAALGPSPKIAILRGGGIGDFLSSTPSFRALARAVPGASVTLITTRWLAPLARRYPTIQRVLIAPPYPGVGDEDAPASGEVETFFAARRAERFDLALQWHGGGPNSNPFTLRLGARITAGFRGHDAPPLDYWLPYDHHQHEVLRYLDLLRLLGVEPDGLDMDLPVLEQDWAEARALAPPLDLDALRAGRYLGVSLGAGAPSRRWPPERYARVADALLDEFDLAGVALLGWERQRPDAERFLRATSRPGAVVDLVGRTSLGALVALLSQLGLLLANDSGPSHMAVALGTPAVIVYGSAHPLNWAPLLRAWHRPVASWTAPCRWFAPDGCEDRESVPCLEAVGVEEVLCAARQLLTLREQLGWRPSWPVGP